VAIVEINISMSVDGFVTGSNLSEGTPLFRQLGGPIQLERIDVAPSRYSTTLRYRVGKPAA
jgi:hypothetical protein